MVEGLAIALAVIAAASVVGNLYLAYALKDASADQRAATTSEGLAVQGRFVAEAARDGFKAQAAALEKEKADLRDQLAATQAKLNAASQELVKRVQKEIVAADPGDAARIVDELLSQPLVPDVPAAAGPAATDHGGSGAPAVQPATAAPAGDAGRRS